MSSSYRLCYLTGTSTTIKLTTKDVEGNLEYFQKCIGYSSDIFYVDAEQTTLNLKDEVIFVYGGDTFDKGPWDLRFSRQLLDLKEKYPERVILLIGV